MKYLLSILAILTFSLNSCAKKLIYPIEVVAGMADLIVVGEIDSVISGSYKFKISNTLKGQSMKLIEVQMFKEWKCDGRIKKAEKGQELFLFLIRNAGKYEIINGSTGEMFIDKGKVLRTFNKFQPTTEELALALQAFTNSFEFKGKDYKPFGENVFVQLKTDEEIKELSEKNQLTNWFFDRVKEYKIDPHNN